MTRSERYRILVFLCILTAFCSTQSSKAQDQGGTFVFGESSTVSRFNPHQSEAADHNSIRLFTLIYEGLMRYDYNEETFYPMLAESVEYDQESRKVTIRLRQNAVWHDGVPFTSKDVVFTYNYLTKSLSTPSQIRNFYAPVTSVQAIDSFAVVATLVTDVYKPEHFFTAWIIPAHKFRDDYLDIEDGDALSLFPIGTGPYMFVKQSLEGHLQLEVNKNYWAKRANIDEVQWIRVTDPQQMITGAIAVDKYLLIRDLPPLSLSEIRAARKFVIQQYSSLSIHAIAHNNEHPLLRDRLIRQAITIGTNRQRMLDQWYDGQGHVIAGPYSHQHSYSPPQVEPLPYDPAQARNMLETAGFSDHDADGIRETPDGRRLSFTLLVSVENIAGETGNQQVSTSFVNEMKEIGIEILKEQLPVIEWRKRVFGSNDYDMALVEWIFDPIYDITDMFASSGIDGDNIVRFKNREVDSKIDQFISENDSEKRRLLAYELQAMLNVESPYTFLYSLDKFAAVHRKVYGAKISPFYFFSYFSRWYIPNDQR